jgi:DNA (cytosine-5)-methyltransferase 3A
MKELNRTSYGAKGVQTKVNTIRIGSLNSGGQADRVYSPKGKSVTLSANGGGTGAKTGLYCVGIIPESVKSKGNYLPRERVFGDVGKFRAVSTVSSQQPWVESNSIIRKLTPIECLRLQSMPDDYFDKAIYKRKPISNSQRYKMAGNAFNCKVVEHILKNLK